MHWWDTPRRANGNLGGILASIPSYLAADYLADLEDLELDSCVHVETVVGQVEGGEKLDTFAHTAFELEQARALGKPVALVVFVKLSSAEAEKDILAHIALGGDRVVGVRMILNYDEADATLCWPQVGTGDYLRIGTPSYAALGNGLGILQKMGLSFDLHCNWHQLAPAATLLAGYPDLDVIVNHIGCLRLCSGDEAQDARVRAEWARGLAALAARPRSYLKLSCLEFIAAGWPNGAPGAAGATPDAAARYALVQSAVHQAIDIFGVDRIIFDSNYPVDKFLMAKTTAAAPTLCKLYVLMYDLIKERHSVADCRKMFLENAQRVYKIAKVKAAAPL